MTRDLPFLVALLLLAPVMTFPLACEGEALWLDASHGEDAFIFLWNLWWTRLAVLDLQVLPYLTPLIHYPDGASLALHTYPLLSALLSLPVQLAVPGLPGLIRAHNLLLVLSFLLASLGMYGLARHVARHRAAALLAALLYAYSSYRYANAVRLHCLSTEWLPFLLLFLLRWCEQGRVRDAALAALAALAILYSSLEYAAFAALSLPLFVAALLRGDRRRYRLANLLRPRAALAAAALVLAGSAPLLLALRPHLGAPHGFPVSTPFGADLLDLFLPGLHHPLWGDAARAISAGWHGGDGRLGLSVSWVAWAWLALPPALGWRPRRGLPRVAGAPGAASPGPWLLFALLCLVLSLGPRLHVAGSVLLTTMPAALLERLPLLELSRAPMRWLAFAQLFLAVAVALAASRALGRPGRPRLARAALGLSLVALLLEQRLPLVPTPLAIESAPPRPSGAPGTRVVLPAFLLELASEDRRGPLIQLPAPGCRRQLLAQTLHGKPLVGPLRDCFPHLAPASSASLRHGELTRLGRLIREGPAPGADPAAGRRLARAVVRRFGPSYVAVSRRALRPEQAARAAQALGAAEPQEIRRYGAVDVYVLGLPGHAPGPGSATAPPGGSGRRSGRPPRSRPPPPPARRCRAGAGRGSGGLR